jgi:hypothetical protein
MKILLIALCAPLILVGCHSLPMAPPSAGTAQYSKITAPDGSITEQLVIDAPEQAAGTTIARVGEVEIEFARSYKFEMPKLPNYTPQNILYGVGSLCILLGAVLVAFGRHFKLGLIAGGTGLGIILLAVTIEHTGHLLAIGGAMILLSGAAFIAYFLWADYRDDGVINGSKLRLSQP